jgi:hypothetical protein
MNEPGNDFHEAWRRNLHGELAVIAAKRLAWYSAKDGVSLNHLNHWLEADGVSAGTKEVVLARLQAHQIITFTHDDRGAIATLSAGARQLDWPVLERFIRDIFR